VTAVLATTVCAAKTLGYVITAETPGMPAWTLSLALGDLPEPFAVGDRIDIVTSQPGELFQFRPTLDIRRNGVTVVYTALGVDTRLPPPLDVSRGAPLCTVAGTCIAETVRAVHASAGNVSADIPPHAFADVGDYRVFDVLAETGSVLNSSLSCPTDADVNAFQIAVVRRTPIPSADAGTTDAGTKNL
jgi:hypothetical protein